MRCFSDCKQAVDMFLASMREKEHYTEKQAEEDAMKIKALIKKGAKLAKGKRIFK